MITFFSGTPGSGKSLEMAQEIEFWLKTLKRSVIANVKINRNEILKGKRAGGHFYHVSNDKMTPDFFYKYALRHHEMGKESQTLIVMDECQFKFSPTACKLFSEFEIPLIDKKTNKQLFNEKTGKPLMVQDVSYRQDWLEFFSCHRHLGYDIILISQFDKLVDPQVRCLFEYNYVHRKANNFKTIGKIMTILRVKMFIQVQYWYGSSEKCGSKIYFYKKKYSRIYDSYAFRDQIIAKLRRVYGDDLVDQLIDPKGYALRKKEMLKQEFIDLNSFYPPVIYI
jgi:zona occludens toxin